MVSPVAQSTVKQAPPPPPPPPRPAAPQVCEAPKSSGDSFERHPNGVPVLKKMAAPALQGAVAKVNADVADKAMKAGDYDGAAAAAERLRSCPISAMPVDLSRRQQDAMHEQGGATTNINRARFETTYGALGDKKLAQVDQLRDMEKVCGRKIDPHNVKDVQEYFQKFSDQSPGKEGTGKVRDEYARYLKNFTAHPGGGVQYSKDVPMDQRPQRMNEVLANQPTDLAGRKMIDCKGYGYMAQSVLGNVKDASGKPRFDVVHAGNEKHVVAGVFDRKSGEGFVMNNERADPVNTQLIRDNPARADEMRVRVMKHWAPPSAGADETRPAEPMSVAGRKPSDGIHPAAQPYVQ